MTITLVSRSWHTEIGVPVSVLTGDMATMRDMFPGAQTLMFGFGKRTFMTAPARSPAEYMLGPFPGPAVIEVIGLRGTPAQSYGPADIVALRLTAAGATALRDFIWADLRKDQRGKPALVGRGRYAGSLFYEAVSRYSLANTCNTWVATALAKSGVPIRPEGDVFSGQVMAAAEAAQCHPIPADH